MARKRAVDRPAPGMTARSCRPRQNLDGPTDGAEGRAEPTFRQWHESVGRVAPPFKVGEPSRLGLCQRTRKSDAPAAPPPAPALPCPPLPCLQSAPASRGLGVAPGAQAPPPPPFNSGSDKHSRWFLQPVVSYRCHGCHDQRGAAQRGHSRRPKPLAFFTPIFPCPHRPDQSSWLRPMFLRPHPDR